MYVHVHVAYNTCMHTHVHVRMDVCLIGQWNEEIMKLGQHFRSSQASTNTTSTHQLLGVSIPCNANTSQMVTSLGLVISREREREREGVRERWLLPTDRALLGAENEA